MRTCKLLVTVSATAAMIAIGVAGLPHQANAHAGYRGGVGVGVVIGVPGQVYVAPPVGYYAPQTVYVAPQQVWVPPHYEGPYFVPGHWA